MTSDGVSLGTPVFERDLHLGYFNRMLHELPGAYSGEESNRLTLAYFAISALDIMGEMDQVPAEETIAWIYGLQVLPVSGSEITNGRQNEAETTFGFRGSPYIGIKCKTDGTQPIAYDGGHLAMTYSALAILAILGDDLSRVCRKAILDSLRKLQQEDGSFSPQYTDKETDLRFIFCAAAVSVILDDWSGMDRHKAVEYVLKTQTHEGGLSLSPGLECHGGATYCGLAALWLISKHDRSWPADAPWKSLVDAGEVLRWCVQRQTPDGGFQSRPNKPADTCYAFWSEFALLLCRRIGGVLTMLGMERLCDQDALRKFLLSCQSKWGGFSKFPDGGFPDLLHSYYAVCGFSFLGDPGFRSMVFGLGLTRHSAGRLPPFGSWPPKVQSCAPQG